MTTEQRLGYRPPLDWEGLLAFLGPRALPGVEEVADGAWRRGALVARLDGDSVVLSGAADGDAARVRRIFGLDVDPAEPARALERDPLLGPLVRARPGLRVPGAWDPFELAVRAVLGQQVTVAGATTLAGRLLAACGGSIEPETLAAADLSAVGLPRARAATLRTLAQAAAGGMDWSRMEELPGIGPWTAAYVAMRTLGDPDAFPAPDLGVRRGLGGMGARAASERAEAWRPWRSYAVMYLWLGG